MFDAIECFADAAESVDGWKVHHGDGQAVLFQHREIGWINQVEGNQSQFFPGFGEIFDRNFAVTPAASGMIDVAFEFGGGGILSLGHGRKFGGNRDRSGAGGDFLEGGAAGHGG